MALIQALESRRTSAFIFADVLERRRRILPASHRHIGVSLSSLSDLYIAKDEFETAERFAREANTHFETHQGPDHPYTVMSRSRFAKLYEAWGKPEQAALWRPASTD